MHADATMPDVDKMSDLATWKFLRMNPGDKEALENALKHEPSEDDDTSYNFDLLLEDLIDKMKYNQAILIIKSGRLTSPQTTLMSLMRKHIDPTVNVVKEFITLGVNIHEGRLEGLDTILSLACKHQSYSIVCALVNEGKPIDSKHPDYQTIVDYAKLYNNRYILEKTVEQVANFQQRLKKYRNDIHTVAILSFVSLILLMSSVFILIVRKPDDEAVVVAFLFMFAGASPLIHIGFLIAHLDNPRKTSH